MVALAVIAILALMAVPGIQTRLVREQIVEAVKLADMAKPLVAAAWLAEASLPEDNAAAGLPAADKIVGNYVSALTLEDGAIHIRFGNSANGAIQGKTLSLRPAVVEDAPMVPVAWVCARAAVPGNMAAQGVDRTDVPPEFLPSNCR